MSPTPVRTSRPANRARRDGDDYVVSGSKIWTSHAEVADWCELLVRTDPDAPKHRGITWLAMPMDAPGITVRPLRTLAGSNEFAEVFLDEVKVPVANRVGEENDGWRVTMVTLSFERGTAFVGEVVACRRVLGDSPVAARENGCWDDPVLRGGRAAERRVPRRWRSTSGTSSEASEVKRLAGRRVAFNPRDSHARQELYEAAAEVLVEDGAALISNSPWVLDRLSSLSTPSPPAPPRSSTASWPNAFSACRKDGDIRRRASN